MKPFSGSTAGVVAVIPRAGRLLVIRRSRFVVAPRTFCFPGGAIQPGEDETQALEREIQEELGTQIRPIRCLWRSVTPWDVPLAWWLSQLLTEAPFVANPNEVESVHWFRPDELQTMPELLESNRRFLAAWQRAEFELCLDA